jgi:ABC-2 type transport system permease protein
MRSVAAIYRKQFRELCKNIAVAVQFLIYPVVAFVFTELVAKPDPEIADNMFITMFSAIFAGMSLIFSAAGTIAEDRERKSLRFLMMAGVKPHEYLLGVGGVYFTAAAVVSALFALMGGFQGLAFFKFLGVMLLGCTASILLGASIGIACKNQQAATAVGMPIALVLGFGPMITQFNDAAKKLFEYTYTQQLSVAAGGVSAGIGRPALIIGANIAVLLVIFIAAYRGKGLRG